MSSPSLAALLEKRYFKEIGVLLLVKTAVIIAIRVCFFGHPETRPDPVAMTSTHLLAPDASPGAARNVSPNASSPTENRSSHDQ
jgi:hypothetical protein